MDKRSLPVFTLQELPHLVHKDAALLVRDAKERGGYSVQLTKPQHTKFLTLLAKSLHIDVEELTQQHWHAGGVNYTKNKHGEIRLVFSSDWEKRPMVYHDGSHEAQALLWEAMQPTKQKQHAERTHRLPVYDIAPLSTTNLDNFKAAAEKHSAYHAVLSKTQHAELLKNLGYGGVPAPIRLSELQEFVVHDANNIIQMVLRETDYTRDSQVVYHEGSFASRTIIENAMNSVAPKKGR